MKIKFIILLSVLLGGSVYAEKFEIITKDGKIFIGDFVSKTDSTLTIWEKKSKTNICVLGESIESAYSNLGGNYYFENGKLLGMSKTEQNLNAWKDIELKEQERASNPNYIIGNAIKTAGVMSLGFGIPALIVGSISLGVGQAQINKYRKAIEELSLTTNNTKTYEINQLNETIEDYEKNRYKYANCVTAGCVLMSVGGALTLVGIPLIAHGNYIIDLSVQISENGAGVTVNF